MAAVKTKLGRIPCDCCGHPAMLRENEHKTLTISCDECDVSSFAKNGTAAAKRWRSKLPPEQAPEPVPRSVPKAPAQEPVGDPPKPAPVPVPRPTPFDPLAYLMKAGKA